MSTYYIQNGDCGTEYTFKIIGTKWTPQIIEQVVQNPGISFSELKQVLGTISDSMLSRQITRLIDSHILTKTNAGGFCLTQMGTDLIPSMEQLQQLASECGYETSGMKSSIEYMGKLIGSKWKSRIIWVIYNSKIIRFNALRNSIEGISHKILIEQLNDLVSNGFVLKIDYLEKSPKVEYQLTESGIQAYQIIKSLADWCIQYELIKPKISINY